MNTQFVRIDDTSYKNYRGRILEIYLDSGTSRVHDQYLDPAEESDYHDSVLGKRKGYGYVVIDSDKCEGYILAYPLSFEPLLPDAIRDSYPLERCLYITEMHLSPECRGRGIGTSLMQTFVNELDPSEWDYLVIRAWKSNEGALRFYEKFGFVRGEVIDEEKVKKNRSGKFWIQKQYLIRQLSDV